MIEMFLLHWCLNGVNFVLQFSELLHQVDIFYLFRIYNTSTYCLKSNCRKNNDTPFTTASILKTRTAHYYGNTTDTCFILRIDSNFSFMRLISNVSVKMDMRCDYE